MDEEEIKKAVAVVKNGGIIIYPTETCYGLGCNALDEDAVKKIYELKQRPLEKNLIVIISDFDMWEKIAYVTTKAREIAKKYWPGPLTIIQKKKELVPDILNPENIAVRISSNEVASKIAKKSGVPIVSTSANLSGGLNPYTIEDIPGSILQRVDLVIDGGKLPVKMPSTVIEVVNNKVKIIRQGQIHINTK